MLANPCFPWGRIPLIALFHYSSVHHNDVIMSSMASQITGVSIVCSTVWSDADQRKHQSSALLAFVRGIHRWPMDSPHVRPVKRKMFPFDDVIMWEMPPPQVFFMKWKTARISINSVKYYVSEYFSVIRRYPEFQLSGQRACECPLEDSAVDNGFIQDLQYFPIRDLRFGDTGHSDEWLYYTLGPLRCIISKLCTVLMPY